jgi:hypothetical protein
MAVVASVFRLRRLAEHENGRSQGNREAGAGA